MKCPDDETEEVSATVLKPYSVETEWDVSHPPLSEVATLKARIEELEAENARLTSEVSYFGILHAKLTALKAERDRLRMALACPPILSKYHGKHGFEVERFISDYIVWTTIARAALDKGK